MINQDFFQKDKFYILITTIVITIFFVLKHFLVGSTLLIIYIMFVIYNIKVFKIKNDEWEKFLEDLSSKMDVSSKNILKNSPFPLVIVEQRGNILWHNEKFLNIFKKNEFIGINIKNLIKDISLSDIVGNNKKIYKYINIKDRCYNIFVDMSNDKLNISNSGKAIILYFYDVTYEVKLIEEIQKNEYGITLIEVDNLDDVLKTTEEDKAVLLSAEVERNIKNYAQGLSGTIVKYSSNKYIMITYVENIQDEMNRNFEILDEIRDINYGNKLTVTLSMGVGIGGNSPNQNYEFAMSAKELALSRGGDQVVIKEKDKLKFYGGKTKEVEKRTKVKARVIAHALVNLINESNNVYIMGHFNLDIDALGAAIGIRRVVYSLGKRGKIILDGINTGIENAINRIKEKELYNDYFISKDECIDDCDKNSLLILVDVNSKEYVQDAEILNCFKRVVIIDHHRKSTDAFEGSILSYIEPYASSTCELVTEMLQYMIDSPKKSINPFEAEMMLAGIYVDTKNFYFKTGVRTFEAAAYLRRLGADIIDVKKMFSGRLETYLKKAEIMSSAEVKNNIAIALCPPDIEDNIIVAQVADELLNISGVQASFVLAKIKNEIFISARSFGDINVQIILEALGGGGHLSIAGAKLKDVSINEAREELKKSIVKYLREGEE